jgi:hypothetical protein
VITVVGEGHAPMLLAQVLSGGLSLENRPKGSVIVENWQSQEPFRAYRKPVRYGREVELAAKGFLNAGL